MTGWHVLVFQVNEGGEDKRLAVWQTDYNGLDWLDQLVEKGKATVAGDGYPADYRTTLEFIRETILAGPPKARKQWLSEPNSSYSENWTGETIIDRAALQEADASSPMLVRAWDES